MTYVAPDEIASSASDAAGRLPISPELQEEFDFWERMSEEAMRRVNEQEG